MSIWNPPIPISAVSRFNPLLPNSGTPQERLMKSNRAILTALALMGFVLLMRIIPYLLISSNSTDTTPGFSFYPWNFAPMSAACLTFGALFGNRRGYAYVAALAMIFLCDLATGWTMRNMAFFGLHVLIPFTWGCSVFNAWLGTSLFVRRTIPRAVTVALIGEVVFFLVTNAGNWWLMPTHPLTFSGLIATYFDAIPFYRNQLIGTAMYGSLFYALAVVFERLPATHHPACGTTE
jgi:hypothetical protein